LDRNSLAEYKKCNKNQKQDGPSEQQEFPFSLCSLGLVRRGRVYGQQHIFGLDVDEQKKDASGM